MESETTALLMPADESTEMAIEANCIINLQVDDTMDDDCETSDCSAKRVNREDSEVDIEDIMQTLLTSKENRNFREDSESLDGKDAHIFACYSSEDRFKVLPIVAELENKFNLDCLIHERDFIPGRNIQDSILRCMQMSNKIVLFFTKNFLQSGYCQYERKLALNLSMEIDGNIIIPVMLEKCQIPSALKTLTYIEPGTKNLAESIAEAYKNADDIDTLAEDFINSSSTASRKKCQWFQRTYTFTEVENGYIITLPFNGKGSCVPCRPLSARITLDESTKTKLEAGKFKVTDEAIQEAIDIVNTYQKSGWLSRNSIFSTFCLVCSSCVYSCQALLLLWVILVVTVFVQQNFQRTAKTQSTYQIVIWAVPFSVMAVVGIGLFIHRSSKMTKEMRQLKDDLHNKLTINTSEDGVMFRVDSQFEKRCDIVQVLILSLIRYDVKPCKKYMADKLKQKETTDEEDQTRNREEYEILADLLLKQHLKWLIYRDAPDAPETRHPVKGGKACFCQILEAENLITVPQICI